VAPQPQPLVSAAPVLPVAEPPLSVDAPVEDGVEPVDALPVEPLDEDEDEVPVDPLDEDEDEVPVDPLDEDEDEVPVDPLELLAAGTTQVPVAQVPLPHAESQHTESTQNAELHSSSAAQLAPLPYTAFITQVWFKALAEPPPPKSTAVPLTAAMAAE